MCNHRAEQQLEILGLEVGSKRSGERQMECQAELQRQQLEMIEELNEGYSLQRLNNECERHADERHMEFQVEF